MLTTTSIANNCSECLNYISYITLTRKISVKSLENSIYALIGKGLCSRAKKHFSLGKFHKDAVENSKESARNNLRNPTNNHSSRNMKKKREEQERGDGRTEGGGGKRGEIERNKFK